MQIALLVDNSAASSRSIRDIRDAASEFIKTVTGNGMKNEVALIAVAERPTILVDYTTDQAKLLKGAAIFTQPNSGAYILDGILETSRALKKREAARPVVVGIATNGPELSSRYRDQVMGALNDAGAALHIVMPTDILSSEMSAPLCTGRHRKQRRTLRQRQPPAPRACGSSKWATNDASISCDLRASAVADSTGAHKDHVEAGGGNRPRTPIKASAGSRKFLLAAIAPSRRRRPGGTAVSAGVDLVSLNVTVMESTHYVTSSRKTSTCRGRRETGGDVFNKTNLPTPGPVTRHERQHGHQAAHRAGSAIGFSAPAAADPPEAPLRQPRHAPAAVHHSRRIWRPPSGTSAGGSTSLYNADVALKT